jgi:hypothetical protein
MHPDLDLMIAMSKCHLDDLRRDATSPSASTKGSRSHKSRARLARAFG